MENRILLRKSQPEDWKVIQDLNNQVIANSIKFDEFMRANDAYTPESEKDYKDSVVNPNTFCMIAEVDNKPVGYLVGAEHNYSYRINKRGEIYHMGVSPEYRSHGIGTLLVGEFKKWCKNRGLTHIAVNAYYDDPQARNFYEKQGLRPIDITLEGKLD